MDQPARRGAPAARQPLPLRGRPLLLSGPPPRRAVLHSPGAMVFLNYTAMQMTAKIVYYGPGLCGKTTNLSWIHAKTAPRSRGEMVSLETETDRTLFFDLLPLDVGVIGGLKVRLQLYTVPGQVFYNATRRLVLKGVDGVVFVADSQAPAAEPNEESLSNLRQNLEELGLELALGPDRLPVQQAGPPQHPARPGAAEGPQPGGRAVLRGGGHPRGRRLRDAEGDLAPVARLDPREDRRGEANGHRRRGEGGSRRPLRPTRGPPPPRRHRPPPVRPRTGRTPPPTPRSWSRSPSSSPRRTPTR